VSRKHIIKPFKMYDSADITTVTDSAIVNIENLDIASIDLNWSGTSPVATIDVQAQIGDGTYKSLDIGGPINISGNSGNHSIIFTELPFTNIKLVLSFSSGTGTVNAVITAKTNGA